MKKWNCERNICLKKLKLRYAKGYSEKTCVSKIVKRNDYIWRLGKTPENWKPQPGGWNSKKCETTGRLKSATGRLVWLCERGQIFHNREVEIRNREVG